MAADESIADVLNECRELICKAGTERTRRLLRRELASLEDEHRTALSADTSKGHPMIRVPAAGDNRITSYAWDQTPKFVKLYVTLPDAHTLPQGSITCAFEPTAMDLRVRAAGQKERYLLVQPLCEEIDPSASTFAIKNDRIFVKLCKKKEGVEWGSVDDSDRRDKARKEEKSKTNQGKSTAQLLSELYGEADEDAKKKLESAWEAGRAKREAGKQ